MQAPTPHPGSIQPGATPIRRQHGSMAIAMMLMLLGLISILGIVEVGYLYWAHRDAQKVADLAALSGAQQLPDCVAATSAASNNATTDNSFKGTPTVSCGAWGGAASPDSVTPAASSTAATNTGVKVVAQMPLTPFFGFAKFSGTSATAVAANTGPVAAFSVGSQLLELQDSGLVPGVLKTLGLDVGGTSLVGYNGLANLRITPSGLLKALCNIGSVCVDVTSIADVGTLNSILAAKQVSVGDLLNAVANIGEQQQLAQASIDALNTLIQAQAKVVGGTLVQLGTDSASGNRGLFAAITAANLQSALNAQVSALDLVNVGLEVANSRHLVTLPVSMPGVSIWASIIEPPSIAIGGIGTTAYTAQIRLGINIDTDAVPLLGAVLQGLGTTINLPIIIDVVDGKGTLKQLCDPDSTGETATIHAEASLLNICAGAFDTTIQSTSQSCDYNLQKTNFVTALGIPVSRGSLNIPALTGKSDLVMHQGDTQSINANLDLGTAVSKLVTQLVGAITIGQVAGLGVILAPVVGLVLAPLTPVLNTIGVNLLQPLLVQILGASPGRVDVHLMSLQCHNTQLVY